MNLPIQIENLTKTYKLPRGRKKTAVDSLSIEVPEGVIFGFLGPNGAGKTTTIKIILDFLKPTSGNVRVFGRLTTDPLTRRLVGYLPEQPYFHKFLKPIELLSMHAALAGLSSREARRAAEAALDMTGIADYAETPIAKLSKGLTQRVGIAQALVGNPKLLILDEPTSGLDPIGRRHTRNLLIRLRDEGRTVFLSSHLLGEVENLCDVVAVLRAGKLVAYGTPDDVRSSNTQFKIQTVRVDNHILNRLRFLEVNIECGADSTVMRVDPQNAYELLRAMEKLGLPLIKIETERESLEEAFLRLAA
ncbi:MAG: ABC transporter ATP-binding protein [Armatimonadetes bacterium]|nr:ABC transporter ATP-binding protein [Armatimonadota bacterium]